VQKECDGKTGGTMKNPKKPTREQKNLLQYYHLNVDNWLVSKDTNEFMQIVHKLLGYVRDVPKRGLSI